MKSLLVLIIAVFSLSTFSQEIFQLKKSKRIKNVLHFNAQVSNCKFKNPSITNFWIIGEEDGRTETLSTTEKPYFTPKITYTKDNETIFTMGAIEQMNQLLNARQIDVRLLNCIPKAFIELQGQEILIGEIFVNVSSFMIPLDVTIKGTGPDGAPVSITIK